MRGCVVGRRAGCAPRRPCRTPARRSATACGRAWPCRQGIRRCDRWAPIAVRWPRRVFDVVAELIDEPLGDRDRPQSGGCLRSLHHEPEPHSGRATPLRERSVPILSCCPWTAGGAYALSWAYAPLDAWSVTAYQPSARPISSVLEVPAAATHDM